MTMLAATTGFCNDMSPMHQCLHQCLTVTKLVATKSDRRRLAKTGFAMRERKQTLSVASAQWMECHPWHLEAPWHLVAPLHLGTLSTWHLGTLVALAPWHLDAP